MLLVLLPPSHALSSATALVSTGLEVRKVSFLIFTAVSKLLLLSPVLSPNHPILQVLNLSLVSATPCPQVLSLPDPLGYSLVFKDVSPGPLSFNIITTEMSLHVNCLSKTLTSQSLDFLSSRILSSTLPQSLILPWLFVRQVIPNPWGTGVLHRPAISLSWSTVIGKQMFFLLAFFPSEGQQ